MTVFSLPGDTPATKEDRMATPSTQTEQHRLCVFELDLDCGHTTTVSLNGWYPVSVACCDRHGGAQHEGAFIPYTSGVRYARCLSERYEDRPVGSPREPMVVLSRRTTGAVS